MNISPKKLQKLILENPLINIIDLRNDNQKKNNPLKNLKTGQIIKTNCYFHHKQLFQIIGFTPKRVKVIRISDGNKYSWFIKENTITEIVQ